MNSGCENILRADLVKSEILPIFVMRQSGQQITNYIFYTADNRAGSCVLSLRAGHSVARKGGSSFLYIYATNLCTQMRQSEKVSAGAPGVPDATANARKRVSKPAQAKPIYKVSLRAIGTWAADYKNGVYSSDIYQASNQEEAIGMACEHIKAKFPRHSILADEIKCSLLNPAGL